MRGLRQRLPQAPSAAPEGRPDATGARALESRLHRRTKARCRLTNVRLPIRANRLDGARRRSKQRRGRRVRAARVPSFRMRCRGRPLVRVPYRRSRTRTCRTLRFGRRRDRSQSQRPPRGSARPYRLQAPEVHRAKPDTHLPTRSSHVRMRAHDRSAEASRRSRYARGRRPSTDTSAAASRDIAELRIPKRLTRRPASQGPSDSNPFP